MIPVPSGARVWIAAGHTDMRRGMNGLSLLVQEGLKRDPFAGDLYVFRGRRGDSAEMPCGTTGSACRCIRQAAGARPLSCGPRRRATASITPAQLGYLLEGIDWRHPQQTWRPSRAG